MSVSKVVAWPDGRSWYIILERVIISGGNIGRPGFGISDNRTAVYTYRFGQESASLESEYRESFNGPSLAKIVSGRWYSTERRDVANSKPAVVE